MKITAEILKKSVACEAAVKFVERNFPNGFDRDHIRADGSMLGWYEWLKCREYDSRGNLTKVTDPDGRVWLYEYDYAPDGSLVEMRKDGKRIVWFK